MTLLIGTRTGLYWGADTVDSAPSLDVPVRRVRAVGGEALAATDDGVYRSADGHEWTDLGVPATPAVSIGAGPDGESLYAGTSPVELYASTDGGRTWTEREGIREQPDRERWVEQFFRDSAAVRTIAVDPTDPDRLVVGIEPGGVLVSENGGRNWDRRSRGLHDDVHHVLWRDSEEWVASTGNGLYRTRDAGRTWIRLDTDFEIFWYNYHREAEAHDGTLFTAARAWGPEEPGCTVVAWEDGDLDRIGGETSRAGETLRRIEPPGAPAEFVIAWGSHDGRPVAGTMCHEDGFAPDRPGRVIERREGEWRTLVQTSSAVKSLAEI